MHRCRTATGAGGSRELVACASLLICIGWILNLVGEGVTAPVMERDKGNNEIDNQSDIRNSISDNDNHLDNRERVRGSKALTENWDNSGDRIETETEHGIEERTLPEMVFPENIQRNGTDKQGNNASIVVEYQPNLVIRCAAKGSPKPNVSWEMEGDKFPQFVVESCMTFSHNATGDKEGEGGGEEAWVDLKLPMLNNAFYGTLRCRAENKFGNRTWQVELVHNANSSMLMKAVRCTLAAIFLIVAVVAVKLVFWVNKRRYDKLYERLPPQDLEIINKFKKGLGPPPPSPCSSSINVPDIRQSLLDNATSCVKGIEITVNGSDGESPSGAAIKEGYRPVKHVSTSPDLHKKLINGGTSTPSTCSTTHLDAVNSWTNYVPYDDKMEASSQDFTIDYSKIIENGSYGFVYAGSFRNDLTMDWSTVAVKGGKGDRTDESYMLESILTELKILASLPKAHDNIVNLKGAYTKMLHKRQAYVFVDYCELGSLANFMDLNKDNFVDIFMEPPQMASETTEKGQNGSGPESAAITFTANGPSENVTIPLQKEDRHAISHKELFSWAWQVADGMNFLHKNRVIHGNLSTASIYVTSKLKVKIGNIGYPPSDEAIMHGSGDDSSKKWLSVSVPNFCLEQFTKSTDVWDYGKVIWEIFSLREQECPDNGKIAEFMRNNEHINLGDGGGEGDEFDIPQYATTDTFDLMLCCWNENATLCPEFDFFVKSFKKLYKEAVAYTCRAKDKISKIPE